VAGRWHDHAADYRDYGDYFATGYRSRRLQRRYSVSVLRSYTEALRQRLSDYYGDVYYSNDLRGGWSYADYSLYASWNHNRYDSAVAASVGMGVLAYSDWYSIVR